MWEFFVFIKDFFVNFFDLLDNYLFTIPLIGFGISLVDMLFGLLAMGMIIAIFWRGARA